MVGDRVLRAVDHHLSDMQWEVVLGALLGDSALSPTRSGHGTRLRWAHDAKQTAYADWKASLFANIGTSRTTNARGAVFHDMRPLPELAELRDAISIEGKKVINHDYLKRLTPLALAIWYADHGTFALRSKGLQERTRGGSGRSEICVEALEPTSRIRIQEFLRDVYGIGSKLLTRVGMAVLQFPTAETAKLHRLVAPYVHPSMDYKLLPSERGRFSVEPVFGGPRPVLTPLPVVDIRHEPLPADRVPHRYDIEVDGTHNYFVDGVMVHNSPETQPGGRALKFYASVRLDVRRIESLKDGTDFVGNRVRVKVVKNKVAPPFRQAEFDILFGEGISREGSILDVGVDAGFIRKAGAWYTYEGEQLGQGRENARNFLKENDDVAAEIYKKVTEHLGLTPSEEAKDSADGDPDGILG
jgi:recombination protein RecA